ncbi:MAG: glycosyltransferase family 2 protein [Shewanella sp.]|nr:glycosyltransferase family 2 protein [Shewanella sp.]MCF1431114.1 glycosyltransferase family 2 protein [Shewanella sp.]MCF1438365.1 glycosyltransferase family 2 protein [Shewanella sp.]MCF1458678.1 glycosyltransferase family 2 protein [Shewanella sp.]
MSEYRPCFVIPCYNHGSTVAGVVASLRLFNLPLVLVDDGSEAATRIVLDKLAEFDDIHLLRLRVNQGKGGAVMAGLRQAQALGFSHAIQIDADGQHDLDTVPKLLALSAHYPGSLISGQPVYDDSVPKSRLYARYATHIWVWIETLSLDIKDSMCGFRAYPLPSTVALLDRCNIGKRMDFDIEILVRSYWAGTDIRFIPTKVVYPEGGISHFDTLWDNVKISAMHTRLFFGMLPRMPKLLMRKFNSARDATTGKGKSTDSQNHWSDTKERGTILGIKSLLWVYRLLGRRAFSLMLKPVIGYYHLTGKQARTASEDFLRHLIHYASSRSIELPGDLSSYRHQLSFGETMLDKLAAWRGDFTPANLTIHGQEHFERLVEGKQGMLLLGSHLGNLELCRALSRQNTNIKINALVFTQHAEQFNKVMQAINPDADVNLIQVSSLGPSTAILLKQKLDDGECVVIVGDRTSATQEERVVWADFLGQPAPFPQGPFLLASALRVPVFLLFGLRDDSCSEPHFHVYFEPFREPCCLPREDRDQALAQVVSDYAGRLEHYTLKTPLQWYNFYNFWQLTGRHHDK